ncbi:MAG: DUF5329 family protein [Bacteroidota bacterium]
MKKLYPLLLFPCLLSACSDGVSMDYDERSEPATEVSFQLVQREDTVIPFWGEQIYVHIDDISGGQTMLTVKKGKTALMEQELFPGDECEFSVNNKNFRLTCNKLENFLIGFDVAHFTLEKTMESDEAYQERRREIARINEMLQLIRNSEIEFIRNGVSYTGEQAYVHLKGKYDRAKNKIKTVDLFISEIASRSSFSGQDYLVKLSDGTTLKTSDWLLGLKQQLD